jgi:hypothetical protein
VGIATNTHNHIIISNDTKKVPQNLVRLFLGTQNLPENWPYRNIIRKRFVELKKTNSYRTTVLTFALLLGKVHSDLRTLGHMWIIKMN